MIKEIAKLGWGVNKVDKDSRDLVIYSVTNNGGILWVLMWWFAFGISTFGIFFGGDVSEFNTVWGYLAFGALGLFGVFLSSVSFLYASAVSACKAEWVRQKWHINDEWDKQYAKAWNDVEKAFKVIKGRGAKEAWDSIKDQRNVKPQWSGVLDTKK